jgi:holo-[acyl-carrier protein] synthase
MDMQQAKIIIAHFLKKRLEDITETTVMDYTVVPSSLLLHRMYGALADKGYIVDDPASITTYAEFSDVITSSTSKILTDANEKITNNDNVIDDENILSIGIDIEEISSFEPVNNYKDNQFINNNFSSEEIQYCNSKANPLKSFAGLFSLKEAIVKADNSFKNETFDKIIISHTTTHKPVFAGFALSLSHSENHVVAVACKNFYKIDYTKNQTLSSQEIKQLIKKEVESIKYIFKLISMFSLFMFAVFIIYNVLL